jgi:hypothetical protein
MKMKLITLSIVLLLLSCSSFNEFGLRRSKLNIEKIKPNNNDEAYKIIDTSKIYKLVNIKITNDERLSYDLNGMNERNPKYLKFYKNGRVGEFRNINLNDIDDFNPKRAESHLYQFKKGKLIVQEYFKSPQCGECFVKSLVSKVSESQIIFTSENNIETYEKIEIPNSFLIYKPDW